ncbi:MAG TPA: hypothetical protein VKQ36_05350, partial [Ktedonobacterales bacterium]|nr:hypothetical protein [Ktedonobacterales bacterium]
GVTWLRHWEFWLALAVAVALRLWRIDLTQFLDDQTALMTLARQGVLHSALPITGNPSSIGAYNPPLSVYLLMPFGLHTKSAASRDLHCHLEYLRRRAVLHLRAPLFWAADRLDWNATLRYLRRRREL